LLNNLKMRLEELPYEIHFHLLRFFSAIDLCSLRVISQYWKDLADDERFWKDHCERDFPFVLLFKEHQNQLEGFRIMSLYLIVKREAHGYIISSCTSIPLNLILLITISSDLTMDIL
jgi:hypothetical protein